MKNLILIYSLFLFGYYNVTAQTLVAGDFAIIGVNEDAGPPSGQDHSFAMLALKDIPAGEIIYITDCGWTTNSTDTPLGFWVNESEGHFSWTAPPGGLDCGSTLRFYEIGSNDMQVEGGGTASGLLSGTSWNLSGGDQILVYQSATGVRPPATIPTFITAIHLDDNNDAATGWSSATTGGTASQVPPGLTNGVNCIALFFNPGTNEQDNVKYTGSLSGMSADLREQINTSVAGGGLWSINNSTPFDISPSGYSTAVQCAALPVELIRFTAELRNNVTLLNWETASEVNNQGFDIECSIDHQNWIQIGYKEGSGSSYATNTYFFQDNSPKNGINYYRLKQIDIDGNYAYSNVVTIRNDVTDKTYLIYPNPTNSKKVNIQSPAKETEMTILDRNGRILLSTMLVPGLNNVSLDGLSEGMHFVRLLDGKEVTMKRLVVEN